MIFTGGFLGEPPVEIHDSTGGFVRKTAYRNMIFSGGSLGQPPVQMHDFYRQFS